MAMVQQPLSMRPYIPWVPYITTLILSSHTQQAHVVTSTPSNIHISCPQPSDHHVPDSPCTRRPDLDLLSLPPYLIFFFIINYIYPQSTYILARYWSDPYIFLIVFSFFVSHSPIYSSSQASQMDSRQEWFRLREYVEGLEEERRKILAFERELPLCLQLVTHGILLK